VELSTRRYEGKVSASALLKKECLAREEPCYYLEGMAGEVEMRLCSFGKGAYNKSLDRAHQFVRHPLRPVVRTEIPEGREPLSGFGLRDRCCVLCGDLVRPCVVCVVSAGAQCGVG
jgi:hypothetical protein